MPLRFPPFLLCFLFLPGGILNADPGKSFAEANRLYEAGDTAAAAAAYETLASEGLLSPDLFYNLGATKHRLGNSGEGVLWMRRSLVLDPAMAEPRQSLAFLRSRLAFLEFAESRVDGVIARLPPNFGPWSVSLSLWGGVLALTAAFLIPRLRPNRFALVTFGLVAFMAAFVASRVARYRTEQLAVENFATVTQAETSAFSAPAPEATTVIALPTGSEVRILQRSGPWCYVEVPGDLRAWVRTENIVPVWPIALSTPAS